MSAAEKDQMRAWVSGGKPEGSPDEAPPKAATNASATTFEPTHHAEVPAYVPNAASPDDYRCFVLDFDSDRNYFLTGSQVKPGVRALVHHVLVYALTGSGAAAAEAADAADPGAGYTCFGGPTGGSGAMGGFSGGDSSFPTQLGAWVPGNQPLILPAGIGTEIPQGSKIVMQVHYNTLSARPEADSTRFEMRLQETPPDYTVVARPAPILGLEIPAGESNAVNTRVFTNDSNRTLTIGGVAGHMHLLGTQIRSEVIRREGTRECILDIPDWNFGWQQFYTFKPDQMLELRPGDAIELTCVYDNSKEHQPVINGERREPVDVTWGEGTLDEMCLIYISMIEPYRARETQTAACAPTRACQDGCTASPLECVLECDTLDVGCLGCSMQSLLGCGGIACGASLGAVRPCLEKCGIPTFMWTGAAGACMERECPDDYAALIECITPIAASEACITALASCGVE